MRTTSLVTLAACIVHLAGAAAFADDLLKFPPAPAAAPSGPVETVLQNPVSEADDLQRTIDDLRGRLQAAESRLDAFQDQFDEASDAVPGRDTDSPEISPADLKGLQEDVEELITERDEAAEAAAAKPTFKIGGRIHFDSVWFPSTSPGTHFFENPLTGIDPEDRHFFRRIRLEMGGDVFETMLWRIQIDFNSPADPEYKDVYIGWKNLPFNHRVLLGNQKRPLGLDHLNSSRFNVFIERPLVVEAFNEDARRIGLAAYAVTDDEVYNLRYGVYLLENTTPDGTYIGDSTQASGNIRLASSPIYEDDGRDYVHWAISGMFANPDGDVSPLDTNLNEARFRTRPEFRTSQRWIDTGRIPGAHSYEILGLEGIINSGPLQITSEFQSNWVQRDDLTPGTGPNLFFHGAYVYAHYVLTGEHIPYNRESGTIGRLVPFRNFFIGDYLCDADCDPDQGLGAFGVGARLSYLQLSDDDIRGGNEWNLTLGFNWWWTAYSKLQFNAIYGEIDEHRPVGGFTSGDFWGLTTRVQVDF